MWCSIVEVKHNVGDTYSSLTLLVTNNINGGGVSKEYEYLLDSRTIERVKWLLSKGYCGRAIHTAKQGNLTKQITKYKEGEEVQCLLNL